MKAARTTIALVVLQLTRATVFAFHISIQPREQRSLLSTPDGAQSEGEVEESFFDLIVGNDFVDEAAAVEEVGGDPWFLQEDDGVGAKD